MSIEIKEGRYYRDRLGQVHGPMLQSSLLCWPWTTQDFRRSWTANGRVIHDSDSMNDLIEEVQIVPVDGEGGEG